MSFRKQLDPVGSPLKFGKKQMLMARVRDNMTAQAFWAPTKKKILKDLPSKLPGVIQSDCEHYPKALAGLWCSLFHCCQQRTIRRRYDWLF